MQDCCAMMLSSYLEDGHLIPQLTLLLGGEPHLVNDFDRHVSPRLSVFTYKRDGTRFIRNQ